MLSVYVKSIIVFTFQLLDRTDEHHKLMKIENECAPVMLSTGDLSAVKIKVPLPTCISKAEIYQSTSSVVQNCCSSPKLQLLLKLSSLIEIK